MVNEEINVGLAGVGFMGRAHSQAWARAGQHFKLNKTAVRHTVAGTRLSPTRAFAKRWGYKQATVDWRAMVKDPAVRVIDIATPNDLHAEMALAAVGAGKAVVCEKPLGRSVAEVAQIVRLAEQRRTPAFVWFNYRQIPALILARRLIADGRLGEVRRVRATYLQDWMNRDEAVAGWRSDGTASGGGAGLDLMSHSADLVRYLTGSEFVAISATRRPLGQRGTAKPAGRTIDNAVAAIAELSCGATAILEASRCAAGHGNDNFIEVNGEKGSLRYAMPDFNTLEFYDDELPAGEKGWRRLPATGPHAPLGEHYWPLDHAIGYAETFVSTAARVIQAFDGTPSPTLATFADGLRSLQVVEAAVRSAHERRWIDVADLHPFPAPAVEPAAQLSVAACQL